MKIIAKTDGGFLIDATVTEVAQLKGFKNAGDMERNRANSKVGQEIPTVQLNETATFVRGMSSKSFNNIVKSLEDAIKKVGEAQKTGDGMNLFDTIKEVSDENQSN